MQQIIIFKNYHKIQQKPHCTCRVVPIASHSSIAHSQPILPLLRHMTETGPVHQLKLQSTICLERELKCLGLP
ncbi:hypothetical protein CENSYa_0751 [Cenarchaeum symbiosum A]|uniref:Uncharacterized protein n=1 Tax=Cenarchaeum symbiosum (strain A) TaxID=414004 RepID=A0RVL7_CENSY|nr:hypothetical protein CENSYa_0751 [Cenarchaeum symbiosum A]